MSQDKHIFNAEGKIQLNIFAALMNGGNSTLTTNGKIVLCQVCDKHVSIINNLSIYGERNWKDTL